MNDAGERAWFAADDERAVADVRHVYEASAAAIAAELRSNGGVRSVFGGLLEAEADAILHWDTFLASWGPGAAAGAELEAQLRACQDYFGARGVGVESWARLCQLLLARLTSRMVAALGEDASRLSAALGALH